MTRKFRISNDLKRREGAVIIIITVLLAVFIGIAALAIDIGHAAVVKNELQNAADAAALAATRRLGVIYEGVPLSSQWTYTCDSGCQSLINAAAVAAAGNNKAGGLAVAIQPEDITIGRWSGVAVDTSFGMERPDAVKVVARRDDDEGTGGPVSTFFARIFGIDSYSMTAPATAALTASASERYDDLELPIGISEAWAYTCGSNIEFSPTNDSCAGWTDFYTKKGEYEPPDNPIPDKTSSSVSDSTMVDLIDDIKDHDFPYEDMPDKIMINDTLPFDGGKKSKQTFDALDALFKDRRNDEGYWDTTVVVYRREGDVPGTCGNPNKVYTIVGFAQIRLTEVEGPSGKRLVGALQCGFDSERGGGGPSTFGTLGTIPNLVK